MFALILKLCSPKGRMFFYIMGILVAVIAFFQFWTLPSKSYFSATASREKLAVSLIATEDASHSEYSVYSVANNRTLDLFKVADKYNKNESPSNNVYPGKAGVGEIQMYLGFPPASREIALAKKLEDYENRIGDETDGNVLDDPNTNENNTDSGNSTISTRKFRNLDNGHKSDCSFSVVDSHHNVEVMTKSSSAILESGSMNKDGEASLRSESLMIERYVRKIRGSTITFSEMEFELLKGPPPTLTSMKGRWSAAVSMQIKNAPILRNSAELHPSLFRNVSVFKRSYELMEHILKIYTYKEGEKPIFHQPKLRGLCAAEGWFMKLLERNKRFTTRNPKRAHLFYLPFSSEMLRSTLHREDSHSMKNLEHYLMDYVNLIKKKYRFWNKTRGEDHFFVACHDWAARITRQHMSSCIRALCNANAARGFTIGKDVSVPVTFVRSGNDPVRDIGGKSSSERDTLAFFAGRIHGYLRPLLLKYWENKTSDMKIFGPMPRDVQGKAAYREFMKSSKYCICARGYGVHTPRVVESIFYECVPVIISDNYVPPFFEVLDWEAFAVFIQEKDIPDLRNILLSIPEDRYRAMQLRVKMVQKHFVWHKVPEKYDLFHMILHSIWYNYVSKVRPE